jgi:hypothetical protein
LHQQNSVRIGLPMRLTAPGTYRPVPFTRMRSFNKLEEVKFAHVKS